MSREVTVQDVMNRLKGANGVDFQKQLVEKLADELCWSQRTIKILSQSLKQLRPTACKASPENLQANIALLNLGIGKRFIANDESYSVVRNVENLPSDQRANAEQVLNSELASDYSVIMELIGELFGEAPKSHSSRLDTLMCRDMEFWGDNSYWEQAAIYHPKTENGRANIRRLFIYDETWFDGSKIRPGARPEIEGFLFGVLGHGLLDWDWRAISRQQIEKSFNEFKMFFGTDDDMLDNAKTIPDSFESSALIGGRTVLHVHKYKRKNRLRNQKRALSVIDKYVLQFHRYAGGLTGSGKVRERKSICGIYQSCFDRVFDGSISSVIDGEPLSRRDQIHDLVQQSTASVRRMLAEKSLRKLLSFVMHARDMENRPPVVFISYSHNKKRYVNEIEKRFACHVDEGKIELWKDENFLLMGDQFSSIIQDKVLNLAAGAIVVLSPDFFESKFIGKYELPLINEREGKPDFEVIPLLAEDYNEKWKKKYPWTQQLLSNKDAPLARANSKKERAAVYDELTRAIEEKIIKKYEER